MLRTCHYEQKKIVYLINFILIYLCLFIKDSIVVMIKLVLIPTQPLEFYLFLKRNISTIKIKYTLFTTLHKKKMFL